LISRVQADRCPAELPGNFDGALTGKKHGTPARRILVGDEIVIVQEIRSRPGWRTPAAGFAQGEGHGAGTFVAVDLTWHGITRWAGCGGISCCSRGSICIAVCLLASPCSNEPFAPAGYVHWGT